MTSPLQAFLRGLELSDEIRAEQRLPRPEPAPRQLIRAEQLKAADRQPLGLAWRAETGCSCPEHEQPCHRRRRSRGRQCPACFAHCWSPE